MATINHLPVSLSNLTCGSLIPVIPKAEYVKNTLRSIFTTAVNVVVELPEGVVEDTPTAGLVNTFMRVLAVAIICVVPTSPQLSGGV